MATASPSLPNGFHGHASQSPAGATGPPSYQSTAVPHFLPGTAGPPWVDFEEEEEEDGPLPHLYLEQDAEMLTHPDEPLPWWHIIPDFERPDPHGGDTQMDQSIASVHSRIAAHGSPPLGTTGPHPDSTESRGIERGDPGPGEWARLPPRRMNDTNPNARPLPPDPDDISTSESTTKAVNRMSDSSHLNFLGLDLQRGGPRVGEHDYPDAILDFEEPDMAPSADEDEAMIGLGIYEEGARLGCDDREWVLC
ncbi:hypothetical protein B0J18DRAFT_463352 [Chaetomium sp. MPI-SDFR-AT-0129]|nr:hypothetical protein B0J18DRAFT_463352 [Chaetomium sp. MPI-SDFR-AT-0129]